MIDSTKETASFGARPETDFGSNGASKINNLRNDSEHIANKYAWSGPGPAPARWWAPDGTLVYRDLYAYYDV